MDLHDLHELHETCDLHDLQREGPQKLLERVEPDSRLESNAASG